MIPAGIAQSGTAVGTVESGTAAAAVAGIGIAPRSTPRSPPSPRSVAKVLISLL